jgi:hypothetical protein
MSERENVMTKIRKALALANDGASDHECETALLMAQRLMTKYGIDMSEVESQDTDEQGKEVVHENVTERGRTPYWKKALSNVIADNFRCYNYTRTGGGKSRIVFLGTKEDVALAKELFDFAVNVLEKSVRKYLREQRRERGDDFNSTGVRNDYIIGFIDGLRAKFKEQVEELCLTPMLVKDNEVIAEHDRMRFRRSSSSSIQRGFDSGAYSSGHREGKSLSKHSRIGG